MSRIVRFHEFGDASVLKIEEIKEREPAANEIRMKVGALGLNRAEIMFREGKYIEQPKTLPTRLGYEAAGVVDAIGSQVTKFKVGDKVSTVPAFSMYDYGVYGETAIVPERAVAFYPEQLSIEEAASIWMQYLTAYGALIYYSKMAKGDFVLIPAASSSVGLAAIQLANLCGATPIATTRKSDKKKALLEAGAAHVIVTEEEDLVKRVLDITGGKGANIIFDPVAGPYVQTLAKATAQGGTIYLYGALAGESTPFPLFESLRKGLRIQGYTLLEITKDPAKQDAAVKYVFDALASKKLKPKIDRVFTLDQIKEAHKHMESNTQNGKIVVTAR
jgi:NADPH:quinone reductase